MAISKDDVTAKLNQVWQLRGEADSLESVLRDSLFSEEGLGHTDDKRNKHIDRSGWKQFISSEEHGIYHVSKSENCVYHFCFRYLYKLVPRADNGVTLDVLVYYLCESIGECWSLCEDEEEALQASDDAADASQDLK